MALGVLPSGLTLFKFVLSLANYLVEFPPFNVVGLHHGFGGLTGKNLI